VDAAGSSAASSDKFKAQREAAVVTVWTQQEQEQATQQDPPRQQEPTTQQEPST
jgi:hypothetical protein